MIRCQNNDFFRVNDFVKKVDSFLFRSPDHIRLSMTDYFCFGDPAVCALCVQIGYGRAEYVLKKKCTPVVYLSSNI